MTLAALAGKLAVSKRALFSSVVGLVVKDFVKLSLKVPMAHDGLTYEATVINRRIRYFRTGAHLPVADHERCNGERYLALVSNKTAAGETLARAAPSAK
jgi:hypothetical protein